jgi:hypothetical protein
MKVVFGRPGDRAEKSIGKIIKVNPTKAKVELLEERGTHRTYEKGSVWTVPYSLMEPAPADGSKNVEIKPKQPQVAVGIGTTFRSAYADSNALWKVLSRKGNDVWLCEIQNEPMEIKGFNARVVDSDYAGTQKVFMTKEIARSIGMSNFWASLGDEHDQFYANLPVGATVHYRNHNDSFVRCTVVETDGKKALLPVALVGNWRSCDLPQRQQDGTIYYPYHPKKIMDGETFEPNYSNVWESKPEGPNPMALKPINLEVPPMTEAELARTNLFCRILALEKACHDALRSDDLSVAWQNLRKIVNN